MFIVFLFTLIFTVFTACNYNRCLFCPITLISTVFTSCNYNRCFLCSYLHWYSLYLLLVTIIYVYFAYTLYTACNCNICLFCSYLHWYSLYLLATIEVSSVPIYYIHCIYCLQLYCVPIYIDIHCIYCL